MLNTTVDDEAPPPQADVAWLHRHGDDAELVLRRGLLPDRDVTDINELTHAACRTCPAHRAWAGPQPDGLILEMSSAGVIRWTSRNISEYLGWQRDEVIGMSHTDFIDDADGSATAARQLRERLQYQPPGAGVGDPTRRTVRTKDGRLIQLLCTSVRLVDGAILTVVQYPAGVEDGTTVVVDTDADGRVIWVSPSITGLLGWRADRIVGQTLPLTFPEDKTERMNWLHTLPAGCHDRTPEIWMRVPHRRQGAVWMLCSGVRRADGTIRRVLRTAGDDTPPPMPEPRGGPPLRMAADGR